MFRVEDCDCRVCYPGQPSQCSICHESSHRAPACPLSGLCVCCRQPGYMAREYTQAWGPSVSVSSPTCDGSADESDHAIEQLSPSPFPVPSVPVSVYSLLLVLSLILMILTMLWKSSRVTAPRSLQFLLLSLFQLNLLPISLQSPFLVLLLMFLVLLPFLPPPLLLPSLLL